MITICVTWNEGQGQYNQHVMRSHVWAWDAVTVRSLMKMSSTVSEEWPARDTDTQTHRQTRGRPNLLTSLPRWHHLSTWWLVCLSSAKENSTLRCILFASAMRRPCLSIGLPSLPIPAFPHGNWTEFSDCPLARAPTSDGNLVVWTQKFGF